MKHTPPCIQTSPTNKLKDSPCFESPKKQFQCKTKRMKVEKISEEKQKELIKNILKAALVKRKILKKMRKINKLEKNIETAFSTLSI